MIIRLHIDTALTEGARLELAAEQSRYLTVVMRRGAGDEVRVFNARDGEHLARIVEAGRRGCTIELGARTRSSRLGPDLELAVALVKRGRLETIVEKAAELGARRVQLLTTRRTNADHTNLARLQAIAIEAAEQTGRLDPPQVIAPARLDTWLDAWASPRRLMYCDEAGDDPGAEWGGGDGRAQPALAALRETRGATPWAVLIGPEGGFAPEERVRIRALDFATAVTLGPRILRADTASIAALTLWQAALGDWG